jgi:hypothetical protein
MISNSFTEEILILPIYSHSFLQIWNLYIWEGAILKDRYQMNYLLFCITSLEIVESTLPSDIGLMTATNIENYRYFIGRNIASEILGDSLI